MPPIISIPKPGESVSTGSNAHKFGYYETIGPVRPTQEDALAWHPITQTELVPPENGNVTLTPVEIGHRLWTSHQLMDNPALIPGTAGTTASTTVYDGRGNFITATLADAVTFAVAYDTNGEALGVVRLNSITHKPTNPEEHKRIKAKGGDVYFNRVMGVLAVSRAIGDNSPGLKEFVPSDATIDIHNVDSIAKDLTVDRSKIGSIQIISTCDGFTDGAGKAFQTKRNHEDYLLNKLRGMGPKVGKKSEAELAKALADAAIKDGSKDNVSVAIQTITTTNAANALLMGVYDGHGGTAASIYVAQNIGRVFKEQCALTPTAYAKQPLSVNSRQEIYNRDNATVRKEVAAGIPVFAASTQSSKAVSLEDKVIKQFGAKPSKIDAAVDNPVVNSVDSSVDNKDKLVAIIATLVGNISTGKNNRLTSSTDHRKLTELTRIKGEISSYEGTISIGAVQDGFLQQIMDTCKVKRNPIHFWSEPHSVSEFKQLLNDDHITFSPQADSSKTLK